MVARRWILLVATLLVGRGVANAGAHRVRYRGEGGRGGAAAAESAGTRRAPGERAAPALEPYVVDGRHWLGAGAERAPWQHGVEGGCPRHGAGPVEPHPVPGGLGWWNLGAGSFNVPRRNGVDGFRLEYRTPYPLVAGGRWVAGLSFGPESFALVSLGSYWDLRVAPRWVFTPSLSAAALSGGDEARFGGTLQFRSSLELAYELDPSRRLGFLVQHVSNAGLDRPNLGSNTQLLTYTQAIGF